jgi:hypothetical protein
MYKNPIETINALQESRLRAVTLKKDRLQLVDGPDTKQNGLYWIYTRHTNDELLNSAPSTKRASVDFKRMATMHTSLTNVCQRAVGEFRLVYNGIGGLGPRGHGGLRERILGEFRGGEGTGSLAIRGSSLHELDNWRYSYVLWSEVPFVHQHSYAEFAEPIERLWRIHYGWPVLCTK